MRGASGAETNRHNLSVHANIRNTCTPRKFCARYWLVLVTDSSVELMFWKRFSSVKLKYMLVPFLCINLTKATKNTLQLQLVIIMWAWRIEGEEQRRDRGYEGTRQTACWCRGASWHRVAKKPTVAVFYLVISAISNPAKQNSVFLS